MNLINELLIDEELGNTRFLSKEEELKLFEILNKEPGKKEEIQTIFVKANQKLVYSIAKKYHPNVTLSMDDIVQLGMLGLLRAIDMFDISKNTKFSSYATYWVIQNISRGIEKSLYNLNINVRSSELKKLYREIEEELTIKYKRTPTFDEITQEMNLSVEDIGLLLLSNGYESLDESINTDTKITKLDILETQDDSPQELVLKQEQSDFIQQAINNLSILEQKIIRYRYGFIDDQFHSLSETAKNLGITKQRVHFLEKRAIEKMRSFLSKIN